ncbi:AI-2E family transporter [Pseudorhodobacter sp. E13]|uniref:AI-2E family transporter n=1 Tax=Pseudorhodobacter sp. E13 TaxID=2487931 RepID=UPI000F8C3D5C|nr:AI-2E family transporter [Pseudorhodobacter sp. E13]RUS59351.1 AI-2E family transporter [Pseudorhodobacter sp. E13]
MERLSQLAMIVLAVIVTVAALDAISDLAAPMALALVIGIVLSPMSDAWERLGLSPVFGALTSLVLALGAMGLIALLMQPIAAQMLDQAPKVWADMQDIVRAVRGLVRGLEDASRDMSQAMAPAAQADVVAPVEGQGMAMPNVTDALMIAPALAAQILTFTGTLFFFLLSRNDMYQAIGRHLASPSNRAVVAARLRDAERTVARYFLTITLVNAALGLLTAAILQALGMPGAFLWGVTAFLLNFVVYLGPAIFMVALLFAGVGAFDGAAALFPMLSFAALNFIEGQFITTALVGKRMALNPLLVFVALLFGIWLWGPIGGIVAIPLMLWGVVLRNGLTVEAAPPRATAKP